MKRTLVILSFLMLCAFGMSGQSMLEVKVMDYDKNPLSEIVVLLEHEDGLIKLSRFTKEDGVAAFSGLNAGNYALIVNGGLSHKTIQENVVITDQTQSLTLSLHEKNWRLPDVMVKSDRASDLSPIAYQNIARKDIELEADGREIPMILQQATSVVSHSDAGNGIGYSYMRIRGSDQTRINVTVNGIPLNDSESHQVFWVNMPDFSDNLSDIQIQRGVGQSTFGPGAFGANVKLSTDNKKEDFVRLSSHIGSYSSFKNSVALQHKGFQVRLSSISSDGYIDRAESNLNSYFLQYQGNIGNHQFSLMHSNGTERTYQAWNGTPQSKAEEDDEALEAHIARNSYTEDEIKNLRNSDRRYNFYEYENEVDDYQQIHNQIHWSHDLNSKWALSSSLHYTKGEGFFEQFREGLSVDRFGLNPRIVGTDTISNSDAAFRRWLDNDFYGGLFNVVHRGDRLNVKTSLYASQYDGDHFGRIIQADFIENDESPEYYSSTSKKKDYSAYTQWNWNINHWLMTADLQVRYIDYATAGTDNDLQSFDVDEQYFFVNPKLGIQRIVGRNRIYAHFAVGQREPVRSDFIDRGPADQPKSEQVLDWELGFVHDGPIGILSTNLFYMDYENQLVPTGELNDVGALVRRNIAESYRRGIEVTWEHLSSIGVDFKANLTLMQSILNNWSEPIIDYGTNEEIINEYEDTEMALSPGFQSRLELGYSIFKNLRLSLQNQWVGKQYLDNTANEDRKLDPYFVQNVRLAYQKPFKNSTVGISLSCYNLLDSKYSAFGYSYSYAVDGALTTENFLFPQAERNFNLGLTVEF